MAKKKATPSFMDGYVPASFSPQVTSSEIKKIPPYEDVGVKYQNYSKRPSTNGEYNLSKQTKVYSTNVLTSTNDFDGYNLNKNQKLNITGVWLSWNVGGAALTDYIYIGDWDGSTNTQVVRKLAQLINTTGNVFLDFSSAPFELPNQNEGAGWSIGTFPALAAGESINYAVIGFIEEY